jgi:hypothetical protein
MPISRELALTPEQLDEIMNSTWNMRIATIGPGARINLTRSGLAGRAVRSTRSVVARRW